MTTEHATLAEAMFAIRQEVRDPLKSKTGSTGKREYRYFDLKALNSVADPVCHEHGVDLWQALCCQDGTPGIETVVHHVSSSETAAWWVPLRWPENPQDRGKEITYTKRYCKATLLGLVGTDEDDDAQGYGMARGAAKARQADNGLAQKLKASIAKAQASPDEVRKVYESTIGRIPDQEHPLTDKEREELIQSFNGLAAIGP